MFYVKTLEHEIVRLILDIRKLGHDLGLHLDPNFYADLFHGNDWLEEKLALGSAAAHFLPAAERLELDPEKAWNELGESLGRVYGIMLEDLCTRRYEGPPENVVDDFLKKQNITKWGQTAFSIIRAPALSELARAAAQLAFLRSAEASPG